MEPEGATGPWSGAWEQRLAAADPDISARLQRCDPVLRQDLVWPLLEAVSAGVAAGRRPLLLLNGPVGAGKSTLGRLLEALAPLLGVRLAVASIDDLYLPLARRQAVLAGNPFAVSRVPPGSHDLPLLLRRLALWRSGGMLSLPRFDKTLAAGQGDRTADRNLAADALVLEGWLMGCRPLGETALAAAIAGDAVAALTPAERDWLPRWDRELIAYRPLWELAEGLAVLRPAHWGLPYRWRLQAEARQRHAGGGWMDPRAVVAMVRATLASLPPALYQDPLLRRPLVGAVKLDGRRHGRRPVDQLSASSASSAIG